jgi:hypothetical protein
VNLAVLDRRLLSEAGADRIRKGLRTIRDEEPATVGSTPRSIRLSISAWTVAALFVAPPTSTRGGLLPAPSKPMAARIQTLADMKPVDLDRAQVAARKDHWLRAHSTEAKPPSYLPLWRYFPFAETGTPSLQAQGVTPPFQDATDIPVGASPAIWAQ